MNSTSLIRFAAGGLALALLAGLMPMPALAQSSQMRQLLNRMERMQAELTTLQRQVYQGGGKAQFRSRAQSLPQARKLTARMSVRITQLEDALRRLTGKTEEFIHAVQQMQGRIEKLATEMQLRLTALEGGGAGMAAGGPPPAPSGAVVAGAPPPGRGSGPPGLAPGPQTLGTIPQKALSPAGAGGAVGAGSPVASARAPAPLPPKMTPKQQYDLAHTLIIKDQNFGEAERVLRAFIQSHPGNSLVPNAHYWLGRTYYVRKDYQKAAFTFAEGFQKFPKSAKAADNLLNLGMSLARLGKKREACTAFKRLLKNYRKLGGNVKRRVTREQKRLSCR